MATRWIDFLFVIHAPRELAMGNVGRPVERLGALALPVDISLEEPAVATVNERYRDWRSVHRV